MRATCLHSFRGKADGLFDDEVFLRIEQPEISLHSGRYLTALPSLFSILISSWLDAIFPCFADGLVQVWREVGDPGNRFPVQPLPEGARAPCTRLHCINHAPALVDNSVYYLIEDVYRVHPIFQNPVRLTICKNFMHLKGV